MSTPAERVRIHVRGHMQLYENQGTKKHLVEIYLREGTINPGGCSPAFFRSGSFPAFFFFNMFAALLKSKAAHYPEENIFPLKRAITQFTFLFYDYL